MYAAWLYLFWFPCLGFNLLRRFCPTMKESETGMSSLHVFVPIVVLIHVGLQFGSGYKRARRVEREGFVIKGWSLPYGWHQAIEHMCKCIHTKIWTQRVQVEHISVIFGFELLKKKDILWCFVLLSYRFYGKLLQSLMDCDEDTVDRIRTSMVSRLGPEMSMLIQLLQNKPCPSTAVAAAAAIPTGVEGRGSWRWSMGPHMYKIQPNLRNRDSASNFGKRRSASDSS